MSFVQREANRIQMRLLDVLEGRADASEETALRAAQQALFWALDPQGAKSPYVMIVGTDETPNHTLSNPEGC